MFQNKRWTVSLLQIKTPQKNQSSDTIFIPSKKGTMYSNRSKDMEVKSFAVFPFQVMAEYICS